MEVPGSDQTKETGRASGRACANCVHSKAKCVARENHGGKCERCSRLSKECVLPVPAIRKRRPGKRTRVAEMEAKIDGLVQMLKSTQNPLLNNDLLRFDPDPGSINAARAPPTPSSLEDICPPAPSSNPGDQGTHVPLLPTLIQDGTGSTSSANAQTCHFSRTRSSFGITHTPEEAEVLLDKFREMTTYFPFIHLPGSISAQALLKEKPFLYHCIMVVSYRSPSIKIAFGEEMMQYLGEHMLVKGTKSLELLQGILTYAGWYHVNLPFTSQLCVLLQLAMSLVFNLGLNRPRPACSMHQLFEQAILNPYDQSKYPYDVVLEDEKHTLEEQRAVVGCFFLSSVISSYFQRMDPLRLTPYIEACISNLKTQAECQSDITMSTLARLQIIVSQVPSDLWAKPSGYLPPMGLYLRALQGQLQALRNEMPNHANQDVVLMHYHNVEKSIFELGLAMPTSSASGDGHAFQRLETLHACLKASQALFKAFLSLPASIARYISFFTYTQMGHTLVVLHKLSTFQCKDWDLGYVRETLDFGRTLDELIGWFERVVAAEESERGSLAADDIFSRTVVKLGRIRTRHQQNMASSSSGIGTSSNMPDINLTMDAASMDTSFNEAWLEQMLGPWDYQYNAEIP